MTEKREGGGCFLALVSKTLGEGEGGGGIKLGEEITKATCC